MRSPLELLSAVTRAARTADAWIVAAFVVAALVGIGWGLPGSDAWAADAISPRAAGLGAIAETYLPGHHHQYPPLHMLLLTVLSLPFIGLAAVRSAGGTDLLARELIEPFYMTGIELGARLVAVAMGAGIVVSTLRLWARIGGRAAGLAAAASVATNAVLVYYAHTGNLDLPYLFWSTWALVELDRVLAGEPRERQALLLATAAVLTKDQAAGIFLVVAPWALVVAHRAGGATRTRMWRAVLWSALAYAALSGALVNPRGFAARLALLFGPASQDWATYPRGPAGTAAILRDMALAVPRFASWGVALAAAVGVAMALFAHARPEGVSRARRLMPLLAAISFTLFFTLGARRTEDRFLLPQSVLLLPYAALLVAAYAARAKETPWRACLAIACAVALVPSVIGVASMDATLLADARYAAERFLEALPPGTTVEVYGGPHFLPRLPASLVVSRAGSDDPGARSHLPGVTEVLDPAMDPRPRAPEYIVLSTEFSDAAVATRAARPMYGVTSYTDAASRDLFAALFAGALGYDRVLRATCRTRWPLRCREVHGSTAGEVWIYARHRAP